MRSLLTVAILSTALITTGCDAADTAKTTKVQATPAVVATSDKPVKKPACVLKTTEDAKRFQKENGLTVDGKVGPNTKKLMEKKGCIWAPQAKNYDPKWKNNSLSNSLKKN